MLDGDQPKNLSHGESAIVSHVGRLTGHREVDFLSAVVNVSIQAQKSHQRRIWALCNASSPLHLVTHQVLCTDDNYAPLPDGDPSLRTAESNVEFMRFPLEFVRADLVALGQLWGELKKNRKRKEGTKGMGKVMKYAFHL